MSSSFIKILIATGGTGGHVLPAQALAKELQEQSSSWDILFAGSGLASNRYFQKEAFAFQQIASATFFGRRYMRFFSALFFLLQGCKQAIRLFNVYRPDFVVGFGSFHSFPLLVAAFYKKVPFLLFESNSFPGRVNRFFSRWADLSAVQFSETKKRMHGHCVEVHMPFVKKRKTSPFSKEEAKQYFLLQPKNFTILVFGGSQGSVSINKAFIAFIEQRLYSNMQVIHLTGESQQSQEIKEAYQSLKISCFVKEFEENMEYALQAADLAVCRAGAATIGELFVFELPSILIPYPFAANHHQKWNALFMQNQVKGGLCLLESLLSDGGLSVVLKKILDPTCNKIKEMRSSIQQFKAPHQKEELSTVITKAIHTRMRRS